MEQETVQGQGSSSDGRASLPRQLGEPMEVKKAHCLFEQSGTFKNEFIKLGIPAEDYDIQDNYSALPLLDAMMEEI